jgi:tetraprenyl-beta-curcumene synthase
LLIYNFIAKVFPLVKKELREWQYKANCIPNTSLSQQALESIRTKTFHCQGGSIYALYPGVNMAEMIHFIVAYQTMSDYLDNLVDNMNIQSEAAFQQLHLAMQEALDPQVMPSDYYSYYPVRNDGGYLLSLVKACQECVRKLPSYFVVQNEVINLAKLYSNLQTYKHLSEEEREDKMLDWINPLLKNYPEITAWEFAAASGSTLGIFCLCALAADPQLTKQRAEKISRTYFPWVSGLHILLDYFIDSREDQETNQLNFVAYYKSSDQIVQRMRRFIATSLLETKTLDYREFHQAVVQGLLAMYLSDIKCKDAAIREITKRILSHSGLGVRILYRMCRQLRKLKVI